MIIQLTYAPSLLEYKLFDGRVFYLVLRHEIYQWLRKNEISISEYSALNGDKLAHHVILFEKESDEVLFKLTWL